LRHDAQTIPRGSARSARGSSRAGRKGEAWDPADVGDVAHVKRDEVVAAGNELFDIDMVS
jgi:hypothetical protein